MRRASEPRYTHIYPKRGEVVYQLDESLQMQFLQRWQKLPRAQQLQLLDYANSMPDQNSSVGSGAALLHLAGTIHRADLEAMAAAIEEGCEQVDLAGW